MRSAESGPDTELRRLREAEAYDEGDVLEVSHRWVMRVEHVLTGPNTLRGEARFRRLLEERVRGARVMDVGCGTGVLSRELQAMGAGSVYGFDISHRQIAEARIRSEGLPGMSFGVHDIDTATPEQFNVIAGRSILHHLDFRVDLQRLFDRNLAPGGRMVFMEPMGHPMTIAFHRIVRSAHTPDEWPLTPSDAAWLRQRFDARVFPVNLFSFPAAVLSSLLLSSADNWLMRAADRVDRSLERHRFFSVRGRQGIIVIDRPPAGS